MKKLIVILLCIAMLAVLVGCKEETNNESKTQESQVAENSNTASDENQTSVTDETEDTNATDESIDEEFSDESIEEDSDFVYNSDYINEHLGTDYSVTYRFTTFEDESRSENFEISLARNEDGCYVKTNDGSEFMYVKDGDGYAMCVKDEDTGVFTKIAGVTLTEDDVNTTAGAVLTYMSFYDTYASDLKSDGSETICGRECDKYSFDATTIGTAGSVEYCIDKETGVCLKYTVNITTGEEAGSFNYECIAFSLEDVTLPEYTD
jgi:outer membrane lipoprotein-sorting protein